MSISGVASSDALQNSVAQGAQTKFQQIQNDFKKLGQDLRSGNLSQSQADFATLSQDLPSGQQASGPAVTGASPTGPTTDLAKAFQKLSEDLQAGNLAASQSDFATIQQNAQQQSSAKGLGHHHHHHGGGSGQPNNTLQTDLASLGTALQSGNLSSAQQAYSTFQTDLQEQFPNSGAASGGTSTASTTTGSSGVSVSA